MKNVAKYINKLLDTESVVKRMNSRAINTLPAFIVDGFKFYEIELLNIQICLFEAKVSVDYTPDQLYKIMVLAQKQLNMPVVFVFNCIASYNKLRLISKRVNFIVLDKLIFIPALMLDLKEIGIAKAREITKLTPLAQLIILYHLEKGSLDGYTSKMLSELFKTTYITANRAIKSLDEFDLIELSSDKEKRVTFNLKGKELWGKVQSLLMSPIERVVYTDTRIDSKNVFTCHINALAHYTMLNGDGNQQYAVTKETLKYLDIKTDKEFGENRIEIWRYNPLFLSQNGVVDRLSLYFSLRENLDERIQIELEKLINEIRW